MLHQIGKMRLRRGGAEVALIGYGNPVNDCLAAAELLELVRSKARARRSCAKSMKADTTHHAAHRGFPLHSLCQPGSHPLCLQSGVSATVVDARFCKPLDTDMLRKLAKEHPVMITVEEGSIGGFASHVMQVGTGLLLVQAAACCSCKT